MSPSFSFFIDLSLSSVSLSPFSFSLLFVFWLSLILLWNCSLWFPSSAATALLFQDFSDIKAVSLVWSNRDGTHAHKHELTGVRAHTLMYCSVVPEGWLRWHLRSQTNLELPEQVYPAVFLDTLCLCTHRFVCAQDRHHDIHLFAQFRSRPSYSCVWAFIVTLEAGLLLSHLITNYLCFLFGFPVQLMITLCSLITTSKAFSGYCTWILFIDSVSLKVLILTATELCFLLPFSQLSYLSFFNLTLCWSTIMWLW